MVNSSVSCTIPQLSHWWGGCKFNLFQWNKCIRLHWHRTCFILPVAVFVQMGVVSVSYLRVGLCVGLHGWTDLAKPFSFKKRPHQQTWGFLLWKLLKETTNEVPQLFSKEHTWHLPILTCCKTHTCHLSYWLVASTSLFKLSNPYFFCPCEICQCLVKSATLDSSWTMWETHGH